MKKSNKLIRFWLGFDNVASSTTTSTPLNGLFVSAVSGSRSPSPSPPSRPTQSQIANRRTGSGRTTNRPTKRPPGGRVVEISQHWRRRLYLHLLKTPSSHTAASGTPRIKLMMTTTHAWAKVPPIPLCNNNQPKGMMYKTALFHLELVIRQQMVAEKYFNPQQKRFEKASLMIKEGLLCLAK